MNPSAQLLQGTYMSGNNNLFNTPIINSALTFNSGLNQGIGEIRFNNQNIINPFAVNQLDMSNRTLTNYYNTQTNLLRDFTTGNTEQGFNFDRIKI
ncbi:MAG: hypothetical protein HQK51_11960 [Oligoflexia bacterium]|nr:hypothetical protein [Oligoflexia bacterium]